jgi:tetratricopeptide (TPR) repeat protein
MAFNMGIKAYNDKNFEQATQMFVGAYEVQKFLSNEYKEAYTNTTLSLNNYVDSLLKIKNYDKANEMSEAVLESMPTNIDIIITLININLQKGDAVVAEKYLNKGLELDPKNKQLYYVLGTSYIDLKQYEKAEASLNKAIEIDPNYSEAQYQLGAHLFNWANELKYEAGQLDYKDPKGPILEEKSKEVLNRALIVLEKYIEKNPNEKSVLDILYKTHYKLGNIEKADEYKKRLNASDNGEPKEPYGKSDKKDNYKDGDFQVISYTYNCYNGKYTVVTYKKYNNEKWEKSIFESSPCH